MDPFVKYLIIRCNRRRDSCLPIYVCNNYALNFDDENNIVLFINSTVLIFLIYRKLILLIVTIMYNILGIYVNVSDWWVGWLCLTSHRQRGHLDGAHIYSPLRRTWSSVFTPTSPGIEPRVVAWQSITQPLRHASSTNNISDINNDKTLNTSKSASRCCRGALKWFYWIQYPMDLYSKSTIT